jgi:hypothetical protein
MHARTIGVEDPHHLDAQLVLPVLKEMMEEEYVDDD